MRKGVMIGLAVLGTLVIGGGVIYANGFSSEIEEKIEPIAFQTITKEDNTKREGTTEVQQEGKAGSKKVTYKITYHDGKEVDREKESETVVEEAQDEIILKGTKKYYLCSNGVEYETSAEKQECEKRIQWEAMKAASLQECYNDSSKINCWYDEYPGTTLHWEYYSYTPSYSAPTYNNSAGRTGAICRDGWRSSATGRGACSHHGGVAYWL